MSQHLTYNYYYQIKQKTNATPGRKKFYQFTHLVYPAQLLSAINFLIQICYQVPHELCSRGNPKQLEEFDFEVQVRKNCKETIRTKYHFTTIICEGSIANNITALMEFLVVYLW